MKLGKALATGVAEEQWPVLDEADGADEVEAVEAGEEAAEAGEEVSVR